MAGLFLVILTTTGLVFAWPHIQTAIEKKTKKKGDTTQVAQADKQDEAPATGLSPDTQNTPAPKTKTKAKRIRNTPILPKKTNPEPVENNKPQGMTKTTKPKKVIPNPTPKKRGPKIRKTSPRGPVKYPRRLLAISVNDYLLANPLTYGSRREGRFAGSSTGALKDIFALDFRLKFPRTQCFELSDGSRTADAPLKDVIKEAISDFCETSRPQDRIVLLFTGHGKGMDGKGYLVPVEGDLNDPETLIPIDWVYEQLAKCPARQKLFIVDVCRYNPGRGFERPGSDPMDETLDKILQNPPKGVQVWSSCVKDQQSYSFRDGSLFLEALCVAAAQRMEGIPDPNDVLPLDQLVPRVNRYIQDALKKSKLKQTPRLVGQLPSSGADFNKDTPMPKEVVIAKPKLEGGIAGKAIVRSILDEINAAPPPRAGRPGGVNELRVSSLPPFSAKVLDEFQKDGYTNEEDFLKPDLAKQFPLRAAVVKAKVALRENANKFTMREYFGGGKSANTKKKILQEQENPGKAIFFLEEALAELEKAEKHMENEKSKRWQAHYYLVVARLKSRLIYVHEYNYLLGEIRRDVLPELGGDNNGYRLASKSRPSTTDDNVRGWRRELRRNWRKITSDFPGTPWALLARRESQTNLGLQWTPTKY